MIDTIITSPRSEEKLLLLNQLEFLRTHRGRISLYEDAWCVESSRPEYTFAVLETKSSISALVSRYGTFYLKPAVMKFETELMQMGFVQTGALNYMYLKTEDSEWKTNDLIEVKKASAEADISVFSEIQANGFCDSEAECLQWQPWLHDANLKNFTNASQVFYTAYLGDEPAGVALALFHKPLTGIYAVTTLPEFRKQGISTTILNHIAKDSLERGIETLTLQVAHGSYAEFFYQKLGFKSSFLVKIMSRQTGIQRT